MTLLLLLALTFVVIFSVRLAARHVGARDGIGSILLCFLLQSAVSELGRRLELPWLLGMVLGFAAGAMIYALILGTSFKNGIVISLVSSAVATIGVLILLGTAALTIKPEVEQGASAQEMRARPEQGLVREHGFEARPRC